MDGVRPPDCGRCRFGESEEPNLPCANEIGHRPDRVLYRHGRVNAVLIIEIDRVHLEARQRGVARAPHVLGRAIDALERPVGIADVAELRRENDLGTAAPDGSAHERLVRERAVDVGRVEEVDPQLERAMKRRDGFGLFAARVEVGHPHAPEADRRHDRTFRAELPCNHPLIISRGEPASHRRRGAVDMLCI